MNNNQEWIKLTASEMERRLTGEGSGHDWWHIARVWNMAKRLHETEGGDLLVVELASLLHDIADWKFVGGDDFAGGRESRKWLISIDVPEAIIDHVADIIDHVSYKGSNVPTPMSTIEGKIVQDADRLDAMGAIGIARCFAYGGSKNRLLHDPNTDYSLHKTAEEYKSGDNSSLHHFYDKLLLLKDRLNTKSAKTIAEGRHKYLEAYLEQFLAEWEAEN